VILPGRIRQAAGYALRETEICERQWRSVGVRMAKTSGSIRLILFAAALDRVFRVSAPQIVQALFCPLETQNYSIAGVTREFLHKTLFVEPRECAKERQIRKVRR